MSDEHEGHDHEEHSHEEETLDLELDTQSRIFLQMRAQNLELLRIASQVAGYAGTHPALKPGDLKNAMKGIWEIYAEFYSWIDPEETGDDDDEDEDE
ncbi:MAG: hypothetical protein JWN86_2107 [Planctomycetota bacterium]|nr:hypothetical protein [Planctomycetota bacterium]